MGICWSEPPVQPVQQQQQVTYVQYKYCKACGAMCNYNAELCQRCFQRSAMETVKPSPSAPPYNPPYIAPQTYGYPPQPQSYAYYPQYMAQQPQQRQGQISTAGAVVGGFMLGSIMEDVMDPM